MDLITKKSNKLFLSKKIILQDLLPEELIDIIFSYIPSYKKIHLNKYYFEKYHYLLKKHIINNRSEDYIRDMIKRDCDYIFYKLLHENYIKWSNMDDYYYNSFVFFNYITFLCYFCVEHNSTKCRQVIYNYLTEHNIIKNPNKMKLIAYENT